MHEEITAFTPHNPAAPFMILMTGISYCDGSYRIVRAASPVYCMEYIYRGKGYVTLNTSSFTAKKGDIYILPAGQDHYYYSDSREPWIKIWFNISGSLVENLLETYGIKHLFHIEGLDLSGLFEEFLNTAKQSACQEELYDRCAGVFLRIVQQISAHVHATTAPHVPPLAYKLRSLLDCMTDFHTSFESLTRQLYCTPSHAIRVFKGAYGITPYQYLLQKKVSLAKMMLDNSQLSIKEVADFLGFQDSHYFSAFFKTHTGVYPRDYRRRHKEPEG